MYIEWHEKNEGKRLTVPAGGKLARADRERFEPEFERLSQQPGKLDVLFDVTSFHIWTAGAWWEETKFALHHHPDIKRLVVVGKRKWQLGMLTFCKPFTKAEAKYFDLADIAQARTWLDSVAIVAAAPPNTGCE